MNENAKSIVKIVLAVVLACAMCAATGCGRASDGGATTETKSPPAAAGDGSAGAGNATLSAEQQDGAVDIARAYFVAKTDFTGDQFEWKLEAAAQDDSGQWWARVSATPIDDGSLEVEQVYVYNPPGSGFWFAQGMGTGVDPATDEAFPEEVRGALGTP